MKSTLEQIASERRKAASQRHHIKFRTMWKAIQGPSIGEEVTFTNRRWRFDFAHRPSKTAIEIEGGVWSGGRHTRGSGYVGDCQKYNEAALLGWTVLRLTPELITFDNLDRIAAYIREKSTHTANAYEAAS